MYIAIEGVIGVGKTTLARILQPVFDSKLLLEIFEENPFLSDFYTDRKRYAFQTQIFFLLSRYQQQYKVVPQAISKGNLISDYTFEKDSLFARLNLEGDELATYTLVHKALAERIPVPDLVVYLKVATDIALQRIAMRDRSYERLIERPYIDDLNQAYEAYFSDQKTYPILKIDTNSLNYVTQNKHLEHVTTRIRAALGIPPFQPELPLSGGPSL